MLRPLFVTKAEYVYDELRGHIAEGRFTPGEYLRLKPLAEAYEMSEVPVRDALRMLQRDGLVEMRGKGTQVVAIDWEEMREAISIRTHLELLVIEEAVPHHDAASIAHVTALLEEMDRHAAAGDLRTFSRTAREFHAALYAPCPSALLKRAIEDLWVRLWHAGSQPLFQGLPGHLATAQREHWAIVDAVRAGDAEAAVAAMQEHRVTTLDAWKRVRALRERAPVPERFETKTDCAYHALRHRIAAGHYEAGQQLLVGPLAADLEMSPTPVHEALLMLQRDGLVVTHGRRGRVVAEVDWDGMLEVFGLRMHLEQLAIEAAVPCHDERSLRAVGVALERMDEHAHAGAGRAFGVANREFHTALYAPGAMALLKAMIDGMWDRVWQARARSRFHALPEQMAAAQHEHREILAAVRAGNAAAAARSEGVV